MQASLDKPQASPQKVKSILIRHSCSKRAVFDNQYQHPETPYILKYAPKYYKSLTLQTTCQSPLLSKVKKIKKLQKFTGNFDRHLPRQLWFDLLGNNRKEIEEAPQISSTNMRVRPKEAFWRRLNQQKLMFFWNVTKVWLTKWILINDLDNFLSCKEAFVKHVWNLRKLQSLKIMVKDDNCDTVKWVMSRLDGMDELFKRLEILSLDISVFKANIQELFKNKKLFSHMTGVNLSMKFDPIFAEIPVLCKNLNSFVLNIDNICDGKPEFRNLLTSTQQLTQLKRLEFNWPRDEKNIWNHFKPQPSLESLLLRFSVSSLVDDGLFEGDKAKDVVAHWEDIKELKTLEFNLTCDSEEEINLAKMFMTKVMKKVQKLKELKIWNGAPLGEDAPQETYEPFFVEDVSHLYESLERFEYRFFSWERGAFGKFDSKTLMPFRNLKSLKLAGNLVDSCENVEEIVSLLEGNQKEGEYNTLEFNLKRSLGSPADWLKEALKNIENAKRSDRNLKIVIDLTFGLKDCMETLEALCKTIQSVKAIKGVSISLNFNDDSDNDQLPIEKIKDVLGKYSEIRNLNVLVSNGIEGLEWIKVDGEKGFYDIFSMG